MTQLRTQMPIVFNDVKNTSHRMQVFYEQSLYCHINHFEICSQRLRLTGIDTCSIILIIETILSIYSFNITCDQTHVQFSHTKKIAKRNVLVYCFVTEKNVREFFKI